MLFALCVNYVNMASVQKMQTEIIGKAGYVAQR